MNILSARFMDAKYQIMEVSFENRQGKQTLAQLRVPENYELGANEMFDAVLQKYTIEQLQEEAKITIDKYKKTKEWENERRKNAEKGQAQLRLFEKKVDFLNSVIMENSTSEQRRAIRKVNTPEKLFLIQQEIVKKYAEEKSLSFYDAVMLIDVPVDQDD